MSSARNHQKRSHRSYRVTKSICGGVARKAWVTPQYSPKQSGLLALIRRLGYQEGLPVVTDPGILNPKDFLAEVPEKLPFKRRERVSRGGGGREER